MNMISKAALIFTSVAATTFALANTPVNQSAVAAHTTTTVKHALTLKDDSKVQLKGYIVKSVGDEKYQFRDNTGTIMVEIDDKLWQGKPVNAKTPVTINGEVDIDYKPAKRIEIDVDAVKF